MEFITSGRDEALQRLVKGLSALIAAAETIKHEEENFHRYAECMIHVRELLRKLQLQQDTIDPAPLLLRIEIEVKKAQEVIDGYKSRSRLVRPFINHSVASKLHQSYNQIQDVLQLLGLTQINTVLNIKKRADAIIRGMESVQLVISTGSNAILSTLDPCISGNSRNQQQTSHGVFVRHTGIASSSVCPLPVQIEARESETERSQMDSHQQLQPSSFFFCLLTGDVMEDPVSVSCDHSFERKAIVDYFHSGQNFCPLCSKELSSTGKLELTSNSTLRNNILEWKKREEQTIAERNAKKKFLDAAAKITLDNMENTNQALGDLHDLMTEIPSCISVATESSCKLIPNLAKLLKNNNSDNISMVLGCLLLIARFSDKNKEIVGMRGVIQCLLVQSMTETNAAIAALLELSRSKAVAIKIEGIQISIPILISCLDNRSSAVAEMARAVLENICIDINSTVLMAKNGYFTPFLEHFNSQEISNESRAFMAEELSQIPLTETSAKNLEDEPFIAHLTEMLSCNFPSSKISSLNCIKQFMAFNDLKTFFLQNNSAIPALLRLLITTKSMEEEELKQKSLEILVFLIQTTRPSDQSFQAVFSSAGVRDILHHIKNSGMEDRIALLLLLLVVVQNSDSAGEFIVSDHDAMSHLFSAINAEQNSQVKMIALKLLYHIAGNQHIVTPPPSSPSKKSIVGSLIAILTDRIDEDLSAAAAAGILFHLWPDDQSIDDMLQSSAVLKSIHDMITHPTNSNFLIENALGVLLRCVNRSRSRSRLEFQKKVCKILRTDLIQILSSGSPLAKRRTAAILSYLSWRVTDSSLASSSSPSLPFTRRHHLAYMRRSAREGGGCPVHGLNCSLQHYICLVTDKAVKPLIEMVKTMEFGSVEAALTALDTLFDGGCDGTGAAATIVESNGATPILDVLERGEMAAKEMAFELLCKFFVHSGITERELDRFKGIALNMVRKEDGLKIKAERLLKDLV